MAAVLWIRRTGCRALASAHAWLRSHIIDDSDRWHSEGDIDGEAIFYIIAGDLRSLTICAALGLSTRRAPPIPRASAHCSARSPRNRSDRSS